MAKARASVSKIRNSSRSHAHKIQAAVAMEQRAREMGKTSEVSNLQKIYQLDEKEDKENELRKAVMLHNRAAIAINMKKKR